MFLLKTKYPFLLILLICFQNSIFAQPQITGFSPVSGHVGDTLIIKGSNFSNVPGDNIVLFGSIKGAVIAAAGNSLSVKVPAGAINAPLTVSVSKLTAYAAGMFSVTFPGGSKAFTSASFASEILLPGIYDDATLTQPADIDGDGKADLIFLNGDRNTSSIFIQKNTSDQENISFGNRIIFPVSQVSSGAFCTGDLDGDGKPDIVLATYEYDENSILVFKNNSKPGTISFGNELKFKGSGQLCLGIAIGDLNNDGKPEVVVTDHYSDSVAVFRNISSAGTIAFEPGIKFVVSGLQGSPRKIIINDLDADGFADIAVGNTGSNTLSILRNKGQKQQIGFEKRVEYPANNFPIGLLVGDFDSDGKPDLAMALGSTKIIAVFKNTSNPGRINFSNSSNLSTPTDPSGISTCDFDGDGLPDLAVPNGNSNTVSVFRNESRNGLIAFAPEKSYQFSYRRPAVIYGIDFNADSKPDLLVQTYYSGTGVSILTNKVNEPAISSFFPDTAFTGSQIIIKGYNFLAASAVTIGGVPATYFKAQSDSVISAIVGNANSGNIVIKTLYGSDTVSGFTFLPPPAIYFVSPMSAGKGNWVTVYGANLYGARSVSFGGVQASYFYMSTSGTEIYATVDTGASGFVKVITATGTDSLSGFTFIPKPVINSFNPQTGGTGTEITIKGLHLSTTSSVMFGGLNAASFKVISDSVLKATIGGIASGDVIVTTQGGSDTLGGFIHKGPVINSFISATNCISSGSQVIIKGKNLAATDSVKIGGSAAMFKITSDSSITANAANVTTGVISVESIWGKALINMPASVITSISPASGSEGTIVTIRGKYFCGINSAKFGGAPAANFTVESDSVIIAVVGNGASGAVYITSVTGTVYYYYGFNYTGPYLTSVYPTTAVMGDTITLSGSNLPGATSVEFGGVKASYFSNPSSYYMLAVVPNGASGNILVTTPGGIARFSGFVYGASIKTILCPPVSNGSIMCNIGAADYQWQIADSTGAYVNISDNNFYSNTKTFNLQLSNIPSNWYGRRFRCLADGQVSDTFEIQFAATWTNVVNDNWENPLNWSCGSLPDSNTDVIINHGKTVINSRVVIRRLTAKSPASITIKKDKALSVSH